MTSDASLRDLAENAGLVPDWQDMTGQWHQVPPATLRQVLSTFGIQAQSQRQIQAAIDERKHVAGGTLPPLMTATRGGLVSISHVHGRIQQASIVLEGEQHERLIPTDRANGVMTFRAPRRLGYHRLRIGLQQTILAVAPPQGVTCRDLVGHQRSWGLSAQIYSLYTPGDDGAGDFTALKALAKASGEAGAAALAISPLHAQFSADSGHFSPYSPSSRLWLNVLFIDVDAAWQNLHPIAGTAQPSKSKAARKPGLIDWPHVADRKLAALRHLFDALQDHDCLDESHAIGRDFHAFTRAGGNALAHHALFEALQAHFLTQSTDLWHWRSWPTRYHDPTSSASQAFHAQHADVVTFHLFLQWLAARQLQVVADLCWQHMSIGLISDIAVGSDSGGSQAWAHRQEMLDGLSIGSPPDDFNARGQNWGVTSFSPHGLRHAAYRPFIDLLRSSLQHAGGIRLDHILGLARLWVVPSGNEATNGVYLRYPLVDLLRLTALESHRAKAFILGEDLGTVPTGFREKLRDAGIAGMQVLWFERTSDGFTKPEDWSPHAVGMTTTHDLPTVAGWWRSSDISWREKTATIADGVDVKQLRRQRHRDRQQLWRSFRQASIKKGSQPETGNTTAVVDSAIGFLGKTACDLVILPLEDVINSVDQPNLPGTIDEHPNWRRRLPLTTADIFQDRAVKQRFRNLKRRRGEP